MDGEWDSEKGIRVEDRDMAMRIGFHDAQEMVDPNMGLYRHTSDASRASHMFQSVDRPRRPRPLQTSAVHSKASKRGCPCLGGAAVSLPGRHFPILDAMTSSL